MTTEKIIIYSFILLVSMSGLQCKSSHNSTSQKAMYKSIYIDQFKLTYFRQFLKKGYNNSTAIQEIISTDHSGFTEPILNEDDYNLIDSLTTVENEKMKIDSANGNRRAEGAQGKRPLGFIVDRLSNKWLDSLARQRFKSSSFRQKFDE
jgi:hypothetical protein